MHGRLEVAAFLDVVADEQARLETALSEKIAAVPAAVTETGPTPLEKFASYYKDRTGEPLPEIMLAKLSEPGMAEIVSKLADQSGGERTPLGEAEDIRSAGKTPQQDTVARTDRAKEAWDRFGQVLINNHP